MSPLFAIPMYDYIRLFTPIYLLPEEKTTSGDMWFDDFIVGVRRKRNRVWVM